MAQQPEHQYRAPSSGSSSTGNHYLNHLEQSQNTVPLAFIQVMSDRVDASNRECRSSSWQDTPSKNSLMVDRNLTQISRTTEIVPMTRWTHKKVISVSILYKPFHQTTTLRWRRDGWGSEKSQCLHHQTLCLHRPISTLYKETTRNTNAQEDTCNLLIVQKLQKIIEDGVFDTISQVEYQLKGG